MAGIKFSVRDCATASGSPTGTVPAIDTSAELVGAPADDAEARGGALLIEHLRSKLGCLDRDLTANQKAQLLAFTALLDSRIVPAVLYTTWCEPGAYKYTRVRRPRGPPPASARACMARASRTWLTGPHGCRRHTATSSRGR